MEKVQTIITTKRCCHNTGLLVSFILRCNTLITLHQKKHKYLLTLHNISLL
jgi:hypothetical protein